MAEGGGIIEKAVDAWMEKGADVEEAVETFRRGTTRKVLFIIGCIVAAVVAVGVSVTIGDYNISFIDTYKVIWDHIMDNVNDPVADYVIFTWRMPRILTGLIAGAGLAAAGCVMQSILRNPLADTYTTGISSGASFGASLALGLGISVASGSFAVVMNAFVFSLIPMAVIILVMKMKGSQPSIMIMTGIAVMYIFNAAATLIRLRSDAETEAAIFAWSVGTIDVTSWVVPGTMVIFVVIGLTGLMLLSKKLNVVATGDESARSMGVDAEVIRIVALLIISLMAAGIVSFTGLIGFVGLVCPHIARMVVGSDNRYLLPASAAFGSALLLFADIVGRVITANNDIQVGVVMAFIGGPMFLYLIIRSRRGTW